MCNIIIIVHCTVVLVWCSFSRIAFIGTKVEGTCPHPWWSEKALKLEGTVTKVPANDFNFTNGNTLIKADFS